MRRVLKSQNAKGKTLDRDGDERDRTWLRRHDALMGESCLMIRPSSTRLVAFAQSDVILQHQMNMYMFR